MANPDAHMASVCEKVAHLRSVNAQEYLDCRLEDELAEIGEVDDDYLSLYGSGSRLFLPRGCSISEEYSKDLSVLYSISSAPLFGDIKFRTVENFYQIPVVNLFGENIVPFEWLVIADVDEICLLLDPGSRRVMIYDHNYAKWGWDTGVLLECRSLPEFLDTVAMGPRYLEIHGGEKVLPDPVTLKDLWYRYLGELGWLAPGESLK